MIWNRWVKAEGSTDLPVLPWHWNSSVSIAMPPGVGAFRAGLDYAHGGLSVQESVVPRITIRAGTVGSERPRIASAKWVGLRCRVSVENPLDGMKADVRGRPADAASSKVEGGRAREVGSDGTVSLPVGDDREAGGVAVVVLVGADGTPVHTMPTVIGENP